MIHSLSWDTYVKSWRKTTLQLIFPMTHGTRGESTMLTTRLNVGQEDEMELTGYRLSRLRQVVVWSFIFLTVGLLRLVFYWKPEWMLKCTHIPCHITRAQQVLLKDQYGQWFVETIKHPLRKTHLDSPTAMQPHSASHHVMTSAELSSPLSSPLLHDRSTRQLSNNIAYFMNKKMKYLWNSSTNTFDKLCGLEVGYMCSQLHDLQPLTDQEAENRRLLYGDNNIVVHVVSVVKLLFTQVLNPFYVFQLFSVIVWYNDQYHYYATCILIVSICSITLTIYQTRKMQRALKSTLTAESMVSVCRDGKYIDIPSRDLSPGDIFEVPRLGCDMHCDAVLLQGNCIVNESMLTGESVPVTKTPLPNPKYHSTSDVPFTMKDHSRHILFCGTHVIQTRYYGMHRVKAVVIRTGFFTSKGELVRSILFPKPVDFKFTQDAFKFILVMCALAMVGMIYTIVIMIDRERGASIIILRTLDMVTIVIPPALPAAMTVGIVFAQGRLKKALVYCISPRSINLCGAINAFCFDKTGTLTEEGLDTWGVVPVKQARMMTPCREPCTLENDAPVLCCMATCHSLTIIDGEISGDTLDLKMFEATNWDFLESGEDETGNYEKMNPTRVKPKTPDLVDSTTAQGNMNQETLPFEIGIIRQFTFSSSLQRMSVVTSRLGSTQFDLYTKGSPEMIASLCDPKSVPVDFHTSLMEYTRKGYRVIALAWKPKLKLKIHKIYKAQREQLECGLQLLGLLVMENRLKPETTPTIEELKYANIRTIMVTGDNMLTALSVSRDCKMIDADDSVVLVHAQEIGGHSPTPLMMDTPHSGSSHLGYHGNDKIRVEWLVDEHTPLNDVEIKRDSVAIPLDRYHFLMTGKTWALLRQHQPELLPKICVRGTVFARMSPEQKAQLVEVLQEVGYYVGMCGDGANDCGALRCAHAGISLSEAEASIASSFTSKMNNIQCVPTVIREGRAALVTSFGIFKYMACYSLTQFVTVCILYWIAANLTDFTYLYVDMILITSLSITYGYTGAHSKLARTPPEVSLLSLTPLLSIFLQMSVITAVQVLTWFMLREQSWFVEFVPNDDEDYQCYEVTALFSISSFQYIILGFVFSRGAPYRKPVYTNIPFMLNFVALTLLTMYIVLDPFTWLRDLLELQLADSFWFRASYIGVAAANFVIGIILEYMINDFAWVQRKLRSLSRACSRRAHASEYERIESELNENGSSWPPVSTSTMSIADVLRIESQHQTSSNEATGIESCGESTHTTDDSSKISETHDSTLNSTLNSTIHEDSHIELHGISHNTIL